MNFYLEEGGRVDDEMCSKIVWIIIINVKPQAPTFKFLVDFFIFVFDFFQLFLKIVFGVFPPPALLPFIA